MFYGLLLVTFAVALLTAYAVTRAFSSPTRAILQHVVGQELFELWHRYLLFALLVTGVSCGAPVWAIEKYITPRSSGTEVVALNAERWTLEVYRTLVDTLQGTASALFVFFLLAVVLHVWLKRARQNPLVLGGTASGSPTA